MIQAILFDLDDTLYDETQFVKGGFKAVSSYISKSNNIEQKVVYQMLLDVVEEHGRGKTFDIVLKKLGLYNEKLIPKLVEVYRTHKPNLFLYPEVSSVLSTLRKQGYKLGIITDGNVEVQRNKVEALKIKDFFDFMIFSNEYGIEKQKPNPLPYQKAMEKLEASANETVYIGDNPYKDFITARKLGIFTIRIMRGQYKNIKLRKEYKSDCQIQNLENIFNVIKRNWGIKMQNTILIKNKEIGGNNPVFIIAEMSANHLQKFDNAVKLIKAAKETGVDAIKLQTYTPDTITIDCNNEYFQIKQGTLWDGQSLYELYKKAYTPWEWQPKLKEIAEDEGLICFSSVFDKTAVEFLEKINVPAYKIASFEITDIPLIEYAASKGKPIIISTGIATLSDIEEAVNACKRMGNNQIALLKCTSAYPAPLEEINLKTIPNLEDTFKTVVGLSDHTLGISAPIASVALGVCIIEKHLTLDRKLGGPDAAFSLEPDEFKIMVKSVREVEKALGKVSYELTEKIKKSREFSRSLFVVKDIKAGEIFTEENVRSIRPGYGLPSKYLKDVIGKKAKESIKKGIPLSWELIN